jgi:uncharacterized membrane protein YjjP (DUF1212 family)
MLANIGQYSKFIVAVLGAISTGVTTFGHNSPLTSTIVAAIAAVVVYLVPNAPKTTSIVIKPPMS